MFKNYAILLLLSLLNLVIPYIVIPFKGNNISYVYNISSNNNFLEDFIMSTLYNQLYTIIGIGLPTQYVVINIVPDQIDFLFNKMNCLIYYNNNYIDKTNINLDNKINPINISKIGYNKKFSKSFLKNNITNIPREYKNNNYFFGKENIKINDYRNILSKSYNDTTIYPYSRYHLVKYNFVYEETNTNDENDKNNKEICGSIGLSLQYEKNNNKFIEQLKSSNITKNYYWSFNYTSLDKGCIILGMLPHEYGQYEYNKDDLIEAYTTNGNRSMKWAMDFNKIYFFSENNQKKEKINIHNVKAEGEFEFSLQLIIGSYSYKELIISHFFKDYYNKNICIEEEYMIDVKYSIIRCKKDFQKNVKYFPSLFIVNKALENIFELSYEDLFISVGDYIYFLVIFRKDSFNQTWKLGIPFLKKYQIIFNSDTKKIGYYTKNKNNNKDEYKKGKENDDKENSKSFLDRFINFISLRTFIEIIIVILFVLILIYLGKIIYNFRKKKKKPYELQDEEYDYFSNNSSNLRIKRENCDINNNTNGKNNITGQLIEMGKK